VQGYFTKGDTCLNCLSIAHTIATTNNKGCNCIQGFMWNTNTLACECDETAIGNIFLPNVEGCAGCNTIFGSTGRSNNVSSC
jgi:hypothetical protein